MFMLGIILLSTNLIQMITRSFVTEGKEQEVTGHTVTKLVQIGTELKRVENYLFNHFFEGLLLS